MQDRELLKKLQDEPETGMRLLIAQYAALVYSIVKSRLSVPPFCAADIEHCVSDTFSEFYCDLRKFDVDRGSIRAWLAVIARNNAIDILRTYRHEEDMLSLDDDSIRILCSDDVSIETAMENRDLRLRLAQAIKNLGQPDHEILVRKYYLAQSSKQIAEAMDMTVSNVDTRTHRAIRKLREKLGGELF